MTIRLLGPGDETRLEAFLAAHADSSLFLRANLHRGGLADQGREFQGTYAAALEGGRITGVAAHYWNGVLIFQAPVAAVRLAHAAAAVTGRSIIGLVGPWTQVDEVRTGLGRDRSVSTSSREALFALPLANLIVPAALAVGRVACRLATPRDLDLVTSWRIASEMELSGAQDTSQLRAEEARGAEMLVTCGDAFLLEAGGRVVSLCTHNARISDMVQIGSVWTPPELRGRGHARAVVAGAVVAAGARRAVLFTGEGNIPAQQAYRALGFERVGNYGVVRFVG